MRMVRPILVGAATVLSVAVVNAETKSMENYRSIVDRNPFGLKPPAEQVKPPPPAPEPEKTQEYYLTGISTIGFPKIPKTVYLMNKDNKKDNTAEKYVTLHLNEKKDDFELIEVDEKQRRVRLKLRDKEVWLSMKDNGVPAPTQPMPQPGMPGAPGPQGIPGVNGIQPGVPIVQPTPLPGGNMNPAAAPQQTTFPNPNVIRRNPRTSQLNNQFNNAAVVNPVNNAAFNGGGYAAPNLNVGAPNPTYTGQPTAPVQPTPAAPPADPVVQYINLQAGQGAGGPPAPTL